ncbi:MAG TPA: antitoxin VapB family protein [Thermoplasmata archaeon]|nr:antitoxin VapB family protein [Thermoplasmata archaeon]
MSVRTVTLSRDAYDTLAALKREGESFSELVRRLASSHTQLSAFAGAWSSAPKSELRAIRKFLRDSDTASRKKLQERYGA